MSLFEKIDFTSVRGGESQYFIKTYTNEEMLVLDNCMGSGSTGIACINTNRNFIGIELDKQYFDIAKERLTSYKKCND